MSSGIYNRFKANLMNKEIDLEGDSIKVMLLENTYTFDASHNVIGDVSGHEASGDGYTAGGQALSGKAVTQGATTKWDATDITWSTASITARYAIIYDDDTATDDIIACIDFGADKTSSAGDFTIQWNSNGIITLA